MEDIKVVMLAMNQSAYDFISLELTKYGYNSIEDFLNYSLLNRIPELSKSGRKYKF